MYSKINNDIKGCTWNDIGRRAYTKNYSYYLVYRIWLEFQRTMSPRAHLLLMFVSSQKESHVTP